MKKRNILIITIITFLFLACEDDDICIDQSTPRLTVVLKNTNTNLNLSDTLLVEILTENNSLDTIYKNVVTDSIQIPLYGLNTNSTQFRIRRRPVTTTNNVDTVTVNYTTQEQYVSKACGFKVKYNNLSVESTNHKIINTELITNAIENESTTNLYIYYND